MKTFARVFWTTTFVLRAVGVRVGSVAGSVCSGHYPELRCTAWKHSEYSDQCGKSYGTLISPPMNSRFSVIQQSSASLVSTRVAHFQTVLAPSPITTSVPLDRVDMKVTCATATPMSGAGVLVYLTGTAQNTTGSTSLTLSNFLFNTGTPGHEYHQRIFPSESTSYNDGRWRKECC